MTRRTPGSAEQDQALGRVLRFLEQADYRFVTPTPGTHRFVSSRIESARAGNLRDVFGWTRPFGPDDLPEPLLDEARAAGVVVDFHGRLKLTVRVSTLDGRLHVHSAAGSGRNAVFLGPDSYRFVRLIDAALREGGPVNRAVDIGSGAGAGALAIAARRPDAEVWGTDVNPRALRHLRINAGQGRAVVHEAEGEGLAAVDGLFDLVVANPPYVAGNGGRVYRDGGDLYGAALGLDWVTESLPRLTDSGRLVLYTGSPIVEGRDVVREGLEERLGSQFSMTYGELDPDVFGAMLRRPAYHDVERIAAIGAVIQRR
ncbi:MAG TPA: methyltransferase [Brevundimonas sp.]|nr:methyltransferase [Brevundimonas sp.]